ncbi:MAG TPA: xanthine dehydrogenase family protein molybdopterin-binding subunit [Candidatus Acidoferrales bacterium]|jgi:xanthine dehydrogenase YagR molybdenum-binding subunit|nr:xanthine dehydrogenase family protein molybdopterin-binding subunit [Candidatus Acidoferrales bacterium]
MADETTKYTWPDAGERTLIGKRVSRVDGPAKSSGRAKYTYDVHRPGMLYGKVVRCPYAHAKVSSVDTSAAEKMPGVVAVHVIQSPGTEIHWAGDDIVVVAATDEGAAEDALKAVKVEYEPLPHFVDDFTQPKNVPEEHGPMDQEDFITMLRNDAPDPQIISALQTRGITFKPEKRLLDRLRENEVSESVISALQAAQVKPSEDKAEKRYRKEAEQTKGDPDQGFKQAEVVSEGVYGCPVITHCCLETHGSIAEWPDKEHLFTHISTQNVSGLAGQFAQALKIPAGNVHVHQDHIGGGFGSKFGIDRWGAYTAEVSRKAGGKPVRYMLERAPELEVAGCRPSGYAHVRVGAKKDGTLLAWESESWGTGGPGGGGPPPMPYVVEIPNQRKQHVAVLTNIGPARAWRAPNHPQGCLITMAALDDLAAKLNMDPVELLLKNLSLTQRADVYREELAIASDLMNWKKNWHPRNQGGSGVVKRGLGVAIHTWGGRGHNSNCALTIHPDGSVDIKMGSQDLGTGTRTAILMVAGDTLGLPIDKIQLNIGDNEYPPDGGSGGSTTIGGVSSSTRRAAVDARDQLLAKVAPALNAQPQELEIVNQVIRVKSAPSRSMNWKDACARLGTQPIQVLGKNPGPGDLISSGVGGAVMADVSVDTETGIVKMNKMVCAQDCGLIINMKTAESQVYGAMIMGIASTLYEEKIMDPTTGAMLNPNMDFYRLAGIGDVGELVVHMMTGKGYDERGPIGLGEPPTVGPMAAISNAVANAIGARVPFMPITPDRVVAALNENEGGSHAAV